MTDPRTDPADPDDVKNDPIPEPAAPDPTDPEVKPQEDPR